MQEHFLHLLIPLLFPWMRCILHARMFCTPTHTSSIPMSAMYARTFFTLADTILCSLRAAIFTVITKVWPHANRTVVTNNLTVIMKAILIEVFL